MKRGSTLFLKGTITAIGLLVLAFCLFALPQAIIAETASDFDYLPLMVGLYIPAVPFFLALYQAFKILNYIDQNKAFSELSVKALKNIKYYAFAISAFFAIGMPYIFYLADMDDAPGLVALGLVIIGASCVIATAAGLFQSLLKNIVDIKSENDLTV